MGTSRYATIIANLIGGAIFFWVDMKCSKEKTEELRVKGIPVRGKSR